MRRERDGDRTIRLLRQAAALVGTIAIPACGSSPITADRIERATERTFANLVHVQVSRLDMPPIAPSAFEVMASCRKAGSDAVSGAGDWVCRVRWVGLDRQTLYDTFDVSVTIEGCYTATAEGDNLGGAVLRRRDGSAVRNLLSVFEGCFDTT